ncbi:ABC-2 type transporter [uncultured archaeon]|nr:ABC-2 type transporter [uncultured archaeon]
MFSSISRRIRRILALSLTDFKDEYRFKLHYVTTLSYPLPTLVLFFVAYASVINVSGIGSLQFIPDGKLNSYLLSAAITYGIVGVVWGRAHFLRAKYMQVLEGLLLAPINRIYMFLGKTLKVLIESSLALTPLILILLYETTPLPSAKNIITALLILLLTLIIFLSLDFMVASIELAEEGIASIAVIYGQRFFLFFGCLYYPIDVLPQVLHPLVYMNPLYHSINLFRWSLLNFPPTTDPTISMAYLIALSLTLPLLSVKLLEHVFVRYGIRGY